MKRKWLNTMCAAFTAAALTVSFAPAMAAADDAQSVPEIMADAGLEELALGGSMTAEIKVTGSIENGESSMPIEASVTAVSDQDAGANSVQGAVSASGINVSFAEYMDAEKVVLQIPGLPSAISYNYVTDPAGTNLAKVVGTQMPEYINHVLQLFYATAYQNEAFMQYAEELGQVLQEIAGSVSFTQAEPKDFTIGGAAVSCPGSTTTITKEFALDTVNKVLGVRMPNGQTFLEYYDMVLNFANNMNGSAEKVDIPAQLEEFFSDMPDMNLTVYTRSDLEGSSFDGAPAAIELEAEGQNLSLRFLGSPIPFTEVRAFANDVEQFSAVTEVSENGVDVVISQEGEVVGSVNVTGVQPNFVISAKVGDSMNVGTLTVNTETGVFTLSSPYLPSDATGQFSLDENGLNLTASCMGFNAECRFSKGGTVTPIEGNVVEITEMAEEDLQALLSSVGSMASGTGLAPAA